MATTMGGTKDAPSSDASTAMIKLTSNDGQTFEVSEDLIKQATTIKEMFNVLDVASSDMAIPLPNVKGSILKPIIDFCEHHKNDPPPVVDDDDDDPNKDIHEPKRSDDISEWDQEFIKQFTVKEGTLFDIIMAANYLGIKTLLAVGCKTIANMVRGKSSTEVREMFNISYDPPGQGLNAPTQAIEGGDSVSMPTTPQPSATSQQQNGLGDSAPTPAPDPMNE